MDQEGHSPVLLVHSPVLLFNSPVLIFHSPVLILVTVQFWFWVVISVLSTVMLCVVHVVLKTAILTYHSVMDAIIRPTVLEEMRRSASLVSERVASSEVESSDSATWPTFSSRTVNRLSGLLNRIRNHGSNSSNKKTQHCQGKQNTGEVVSLWWKEDKRMVKHVSGVSKTPNTSRVYCILTILLAHFLPLIDVLFLFALVRLLGSPRTAKRYNLRLNQLLSG